jgi:hypothetical protein
MNKLRFVLSGEHAVSFRGNVGRGVRSANRVLLPSPRLLVVRDGMHPREQGSAAGGPKAHSEIRDRCVRIDAGAAEAKGAGQPAIPSPRTVFRPSRHEGTSPVLRRGRGERA